jgi:translation initiation factor IF-3
LVDPDGAQLGIKPLPDALAIARQLDLDLVEVAPNANPPVCRIMDFGKFKFDEAQRAKESRRKTTSSSIKEMKYRPKIGVGDFDTKTRQVTKFLGEGHKVKITIMFRGREMSHPELGKKLLDQVALQVGTIAKIEAAPKLDGRNMIMVLAPDRRAGAQATAAAPRPPSRPASSQTANEAGAPAPTAPPAPAPPAAPAAPQSTAPTAPAFSPPPSTSPAPSTSPPPSTTPTPAAPPNAAETVSTPSDAAPTPPASTQPNGRLPGPAAPTSGAATSPGPAEET